jgi:hypothetical protein
MSDLLGPRDRQQRETHRHYDTFEDFLRADFFAVFFAGLPRPIEAVSQLGCLHFGQRTGRESTRLNHACPHRRHSQILSIGMVILYLFAMIANFC